MLIDWFTVIAELLNFLILVWLLQRLLYKPILTAIEERQTKIAAQLSEAADARASALTSQQSLDAEKKDLGDRKDALLAQAQKDALAEKQRLLDAAQAETQELRQRLQRSVRADEIKLESDIARTIREQAFAIARRILQDLSAKDLDEIIAANVVRKLSEPGSREQLAFADGKDGAIVVKSAHELTESVRRDLTRALPHEEAVEQEVRFEVDPELVCGLQIMAGGRRLEFSATDELTDMETHVTDALDQTPKYLTSGAP